MDTMTIGDLLSAAAFIRLRSRCNNTPCYLPPVLPLRTFLDRSLSGSSPWTLPPWVTLPGVHDSRRLCSQGSLGTHKPTHHNKTFEDSDLFHLIGVVCGLAIYNFTIVELHFPLALYKKLLNRKPSLEDLKELMPDVGRSMQQLLDYPEDDVEDTFCLNFTITVENFGATEVKELIPNGADIPVVKQNRQEFVDAYVNYVFNKSVASLYDAFHEGFHKVCGGKVLQLFEPNELQAMVIGNTNYDWKELEKNTQYKGEYWADHPTIKLFWEVFHELPLEKKKQFLLFLTGSDRIPILGMKSLSLIIQPTGGGDGYLPVSHTCFNLLDLPKYTSKDTLRSKLIQAIDHYEGFNLV